MNKQFHALCGIAIKYNFTNMIFSTNGMLLTEKRLGELPAGGRTRYTFAIDYCADPELFEEVRGRKGSWKVIYDNVRASLSNSSHSHFFFSLGDITSYKTLDATITDAAFGKLKSLFADAGGRIVFRRKTFHNSTGLTPGACQQQAGEALSHLPLPLDFSRYRFRWRRSGLLPGFAPADCAWKYSRSTLGFDLARSRFSGAAKESCGTCSVEIQGLPRL